MACDTIDIGSEADCEDLPTGGTKARAVVFNYEDVLSYTEGASDIVSAITLSSGAVGYEFTGYRNDVKSSQEVVKPETGIIQFKHLFGMTIYERTQEQKNNVERLSRGLFIVIVENKGNDDSSFEILGTDVGMEISAGAIRNVHENGGYFILGFETPED